MSKKKLILKRPSFVLIEGYSFTSFSAKSGLMLLDELRDAM
jgi:hypothetical protein